MSVRSWQRVVRIKERRTEQQRATLQEARSQLARARDELDAARRELDARNAELEAARRRVRELFDGVDTFRPELVLRLRERIEESAGRVADAERGLQAAQSRFDTTQVEVREAKRQLDRMEQQLTLSKDRLEKALRERENAAEDRQDEDSEDAAVTRMLAAARAAAAEDHERRV